MPNEGIRVDDKWCFFCINTDMMVDQTNPGYIKRYVLFHQHASQSLFLILVREPIIVTITHAASL